MSERFPGEIYIGGGVPKSKMEGLIVAIMLDEACADWGDAPISFPDVEESLEECIEILLEQIYPDKTLFLCDSEARYGEFDNIEAYCIENKISFTRKSSGYLEYLPEVKEYRSEWEDCVTYETNGDDETISSKSILDLLHYDDIDALKDAIRKVIVSSDITKLEPFVITP